MDKNSRSPRSGGAEEKEKESFHVIHKVPSGDGPYVRAKQAQLVHKDPEAAIIWFWKAINAGDRIDSALKDMAVVMKQLDRSKEAIEAIKSFRVLCSKQAQQSLDNLLIDLYKKCGMVDEQIDLLRQKLRMIYHGQAFNGKLTRTARSHGKKFQVSIQQDFSRILGNPGVAGGGGLLRDSAGNFIKAFAFKCGVCGALTAEIWALFHGLRLATGMGIPRLRIESDSLLACRAVSNVNLRVHPDFHLVKQCHDILQQTTSVIQGNLGWAYMQKKNYIAAEAVYRKAQMIDPNANKACNLGLCLMKQARNDESRSVLEEVVQGRLSGSDDTKSRKRAQELLQELEESCGPPHMLSSLVGLKFDMDLFDGLDPLDRKWTPSRPKRLPVFEQISNFKHQLAC